MLNGHKWWTSGALNPRCRLIVFMGRVKGTTSSGNEAGNTHGKHSMVLVPMDSPGVKIMRPLRVSTLKHVSELQATIGIPHSPHVL